MLKTRNNGEIWCVSQPDHAAISGYLAAHWGNEAFQRPGYYAPAPDHEVLRAAVVLGVAEHDNGWWEWEATPELSDVDGLPLDLTDVLRDQQDAMNRWRRGIPRFSDNHPYGSLLTSFHAFWLYAPRCRESTDPAFLHPLFQEKTTPQLTGAELEEAQAFVAEVEQQQSELIRRIETAPSTAHWVDPQHLNPHVRLLQLLDGLSLSLCSGIVPTFDRNSRGPGQNAFTLSDVPRSTWKDRVRIDVYPLGDRRIACTPYPFGVDPLSVFVPVRKFAAERRPSGSFPTFWNAQPIQHVRFEFCTA